MTFDVSRVITKPGQGIDAIDVIPLYYYCSTDEGLTMTLIR